MSGETVAPVRPAVSVIMAVYNPGRFLAAAVRGILAQSLENLELIAVDDGSTDGSAELLRRAAAADRRVRVITQKNGGVVSARNCAVRAARAALLAINDADDVSSPQRLQLQWQYMMSHPRCVAVGSRIRLIDSTRRCIGTGFRLTSHEEIDQWHLTSATAGIAHSAAMIRADAFNLAGGYRQGFQPSEDFDLWLRLAEMGNLANVPSVLVDYQLHDSSLTNTQNVTQRRNANRAVVEARSRRGLPRQGSFLEAAGPDKSLTPQIHWANMAAESGFYSAARRLAAQGLTRSPRLAAAWYTYLTTSFGPAMPQVRERIRPWWPLLRRLLGRE